jgi:tripartite-type tricarboxylate transporter receptor subunit TctC
MSLRRMHVALIILVAALVAASPVHAQADPFYAGKGLTLLINFAAGGPADIEGRLFARHFGKHIDGNPAIIVQNRDGAGGLVGTNFLGELGPRDGTMAGYLTAAAWNYVIDPGSYRVDFSTYEFVAYQPVNVVYYMRSDTPPGMKTGADLMRATGLVAGGLAVDSSKDLLIRLTLDMLGVPYQYVTGFRSSAPARLAFQRGEISFFSESSPSYFAVVEPTMVKKGQAITVFYDPIYDGKTFAPFKPMDDQSVPGFPEFHRKLKGKLPSGPMWDAYRANLAIDSAMLRTVVLPPGVPAAAVDALRSAVARLNNDPEFARDAQKSLQFVPHYVTGGDLNAQVRRTLVVKPEIRAFVAGYTKKAPR